MHAVVESCGNTQTHTHTRTHRPSTVTLAEHAHLGNKLCYLSPASHSSSTNLQKYMFKAYVQHVDLQSVSELPSLCTYLYEWGCIIYQTLCYPTLDIYTELSISAWHIQCLQHDVMLSMQGQPVVYLSFLT